MGGLMGGDLGGVHLSASPDVETGAVAWSFSYPPYDCAALESKIVWGLVPWCIGMGCSSD